MQTLKLILEALRTFARQVWLLPQSAATAVRERRRQIEADALEVERLDRIRNPSKYLGK
jgi:hypothetical protein